MARYSVAKQEYERSIIDGIQTVNIYVTKSNTQSVTKSNTIVACVVPNSLYCFGSFWGNHPEYDNFCDYGEAVASVAPGGRTVAWFSAVLGNIRQCDMKGVWAVRQLWDDKRESNPTMMDNIRSRTIGQGHLRVRYSLKKMGG